MTDHLHPTRTEGAIPPQAAAPPSGDGFPENWKEGLSCLIHSRLAIFQAESKKAAAVIGRKVVLLAVGVLFAAVAWLIIISGLIGLLTVQLSWPWYYVAFAIAGVHLFIGLIALILASTGKNEEGFTVTRSEFKKDQEWLKNLKTPSK